MTTVVTAATVGLVRDSVYETQASWTTATSISNTHTPDESSIRLVLEFYEHDLYNQGWLTVVAKTEDGVTTLAPRSKMTEEEISDIFRRPGKLCSFGKEEEGNLQGLLAALFNSALASEDQTVRVSAGNILNKLSDAIRPLTDIFSDASPTDQDVILTDESAGYVALTEFSYAVMLAVLLDHDKRIDTKHNGTVVLSEDLIVPPEGKGEREIKILCKPGTILTFPLTYMHGTSVSIVDIELHVVADPYH